MSASITTTISLDAATLQELPSPSLADLAMASLKLLAERFNNEEKYYYAKAMLAILTQLQPMSRPGYEATIPELVAKPSPPSQ